jgi:hypothetical protein
MPSVVHRDIDVWMARVSLIHFWIISHRYLDRVMRQFGFFQYIPPTTFLSWHTHLTLDNVDHTSKPSRTNWRIHWQIYVNEWADVDYRLVHLRVRMIFASDRTTCGGMRVMACILCFFSITLLLIWISHDQYHAVSSVGLHAVSSVAYVPRGHIPTRQVQIFFYYVFLIRNNTACNQFNFLNIYRVYGL